MHIWIGSKPAPMKWLDTWPAKHSDWNYSIFTDEMLKNRKWYNQELIEHYYNKQAWAGVADLVRYELLYERGGFIPPADSACLHNTDELFTSPENYAYTCYENQKAKPGYVCPILAANPGNKMLKDILEMLHTLKPHQLHPQPFMSTGNHMLSKITHRYTDQLTIWPSHTLIPQWYAKGSPRYDGPGKIYADQFWGSTGMPGSTGYEEGTY